MIFKRLADGVCAPAERRLDGRIRRAWSWFLGVGFVLCLAGCVSLKSSSARTPDHVSVTPERYEETVKATYWEAAAVLEKQGYDLKHNIRTVEVVTTGLVRGPSGKLGFPYGYSSTGIAGGTTGGNKIRVAVDEQGNIYHSAMIHEWGHAILQANHFMGDQEIELRRMGL